MAHGRRTHGNGFCTPQSPTKVPSLLACSYTFVLGRGQRMLAPMPVGLDFRTKVIDSFIVSGVSPGYPKRRNPVHWSPAFLVIWTARKFCSTVTFLFIRLSIFCDPDSNPKATPFTPALFKKLRNSSSTVSTRPLTLKTIPNFSLFIAPSTSIARFLFTVKISSSMWMLLTPFECK